VESGRIKEGKRGERLDLPPREMKVQVSKFKGGNEEKNRPKTHLKGGKRGRVSQLNKKGKGEL